MLGNATVVLEHRSSLHNEGKVVIYISIVGKDIAQQLAVMYEEVPR